MSAPGIRDNHEFTTTKAGSILNSKVSLVDACAFFAVIVSCIVLVAGVLVCLRGASVPKSRVSR